MTTCCLGIYKDFEYIPQANPDLDLSDGGEELLEHAVEEFRKVRVIK